MYAPFLLYTMSQVCLFYACIKINIFGECIITEKKQSGFEVIICDEVTSITKKVYECIITEKKRSGFEVIICDEVTSITKKIYECIITEKYC